MKARVKAVNEAIARRATLIFGSMWVTYVLFAYGFLPLLFPGAMTTLLYWSNTVQLWSLPLLMVGSNVLGRAAERRQTETHDAVMEELRLLREVVHETSTVRTVDGSASQDTAV